MPKKRKRIKPLKYRPTYPPGKAEALGLVSVTRVEAVSRILDTAIWLWILEKDPLAIHLLVMSQYNCIQDLAKDTGKGPFSASYIEASQLNLVYDFLRHSSKNTDAGVDFMPVTNGCALFDVICSFEDLFNRTTPYMKAFLVCFTIGFAQNDARSRNTIEQELPKGLTTADLIGLSRKTCFNKVAKALGGEEVGGSHIESP